MTRNRTLAITVFASILLRAATAAAQDTPAPSAQPTKPMPNAYRGMFVCEQVPGGADVLHVPIDMIIRGDNVLFARPCSICAARASLAANWAWARWMATAKFA